MPLDENVMKKRPGDRILSADWNALAEETVRLDATTKLKNQSIGFEMLRAQSWENVSTSNEWTPVISSEEVEFDTPTSLLLIGQGHGHSDTQGVVLSVTIRVDGKILAMDEDGPWGGGFLQSGSPPNTWIPITAIAGCQVPQGKSKVELVIHRSGQSGKVKFNAPTLWLIRLGAS